MKVMFYHQGGWFVGDVLRFDEDRERFLIERQQKGGYFPRLWISEDLVRPLPKGAPKSAIAP